MSTPGTPEVPVRGRTRRAAIAAVAGCAVVVAAGTGLAAPGAARAAAMAVLPGSVAPAATAGTAVGAVPAGQQETVQVWLTPGAADAAAFATAVSTPGNASFHHYLSPNAYTARFGSSAARAAAVTRWLSGAGLTQVHADSGRDYVSASGTAARIQSAFSVKISQYRVTGTNGKTAVVQSNDRAVSVPAALAPDVLAVTGLNSAPPAAAAAGPLAAAVTCCRPAAITPARSGRPTGPRGRAPAPARPSP
ncbi:MAG TPA: protease pro-enzyme activation domain-containing protein [Trebonia sp.]